MLNTKFYGGFQNNNMADVLDHSETRYVFGVGNNFYCYRPQLNHYCPTCGFLMFRGSSLKINLKCAKCDLVSSPDKLVKAS